MSQKQSTFTLTTPEWVDAGCTSFGDVLAIFFSERREADEKRASELSSPKIEPERSATRQARFGVIDKRRA